MAPIDVKAKVVQSRAKAKVMPSCIQAKVVPIYIKANVVPICSKAKVVQTCVKDIVVPILLQQQWCKLSASRGGKGLRSKLMAICRLVLATAHKSGTTFKEVLIMKGKMAPLV